VEVLEEARRRRGDGLRPLRWSHALALAPVAGAAAWEVYVRQVLGVAGGVAGAAQNWGQHLVPPWQALADSTAVAFSTQPEELVNLAAVLGLAIAVAAMWRRLPASYTAYSAATLASLLFRETGLTPLASAGRYTLVVFPVFVLLGAMVRNRWAHLAVVAASAAALEALFVLFAAYDFVG
jgi:hypothetical protein